MLLLKINLLKPNNSCKQFIKKSQDLLEFPSRKFALPFKMYYSSHLRFSFTTHRQDHFKLFISSEKYIIGIITCINNIPGVESKRWRSTFIVSYVSSKRGFGYNGTSLEVNDRTAQLEWGSRYHKYIHQLIEPQTPHLPLNISPVVFYPRTVDHMRNGQLNNYKGQVRIFQMRKGQVKAEQVKKG